MVKVSEETEKALKEVKAEIGMYVALPVTDDHHRGWNDGILFSQNIIDRHITDGTLKERMDKAIKEHIKEDEEEYKKHGQSNI